MEGNYSFSYLHSTDFQDASRSKENVEPYTGYQDMLALFSLYMAIPNANFWCTKDISAGYNVTTK